MKFIVHKSRGEESGLGVCTYLAILFETNELLPSRKKLTDRMIETKLKKEFPGKKLLRLKSGLSIDIPKYRSYYNAGRLTGGIRPTLPSFSYNEFGLPLNRITGEVLLPDEVEARKKHHLWQIKHGNNSSDGSQSSSKPKEPPSPEATEK